MKLLLLLVLIVHIATIFATEGDLEDPLHTTPQKTRKVAIVGAGIAGASTAYYAFEGAKNSGANLEITVYERGSQVGGRTTHINVEGVNVELGASILYNENWNIVNLTRKFNFTLAEVKSDSKLGIWTGKDFVFLESDWYIVNVFNVLWRYGLSPRTAIEHTLDTKNRFVKIYELLQRKVYSSAEDIYSDLNLLQHTEKRFDEFLLEHGANKAFVDELGTIATRVNYNQPPSMHALGGFISYLGATGGFSYVKEGHSSLSKAALKYAGANVKLNTEVTKISKRENTPGYEVSTVDLKTNEQHTEAFDIVVVATPFETSNIGLENIEVPPIARGNRRYQWNYVTVVTGKLNASYFNLTDELMPSEIFTTENDTLPFTSIALKRKAQSDPSLGVYKMFGRVEATEDLLNALFTKRTFTHRHYWPGAYPKLLPLQDPKLPFEISKDLYYVNAMESPFSTMETESIGGQNVANLILQSLKGN